MPCHSHSGRPCEQYGTWEQTGHGRGRRGGCGLCCLPPPHSWHAMEKGEKGSESLYYERKVRGGHSHLSITWHGAHMPCWATCAAARTHASSLCGHACLLCPGARAFAARSTHFTYTPVPGRTWQEGLDCCLCSVFSLLSGSVRAKRQASLTYPTIIYTPCCPGRIVAF